MALQKNLVACGPGLTVFGMVLRFIAGPAAMAIGAIAVGLHGDVLRVAIIQVLSLSLSLVIYTYVYVVYMNLGPDGVCSLY